MSLARRRIEVQNVNDKEALIYEVSQPESPTGALCFYGTFHYVGGSLDVDEVKTIGIKRGDLARLFVMGLGSVRCCATRRSHGCCSKFLDALRTNA
jgi:hypothetical protein